MKSNLSSPIPFALLKLVFLGNWDFSCIISWLDTIKCDPNQSAEKCSLLRNVALWLGMVHHGRKQWTIGRCNLIPY